LFKKINNLSKDYNILSFWLVITKLVSRLRSFSYSDRLSILGLTTLEERRSRGDLISLFKVHHGLLDVNWLASTKYMSSISSHGPASAIRGHKKRLLVQSTQCPARRNFFSNRIASKWNNLPDKTISARSLNSLKARLDSTTASRPTLGALS